MRGKFVDSGNGWRPFIAETTVRRIIYDYDALHRHAKLCLADSRLSLMKLLSFRPKNPEYPEMAKDVASFLLNHRHLRLVFHIVQFLSVLQFFPYLCPPA